ncbi:MAG: cytochrome, partial [Sphingomonas bacterium]|nr:cytochrome [Sphingomonas bacterium]
ELVVESPLYARKTVYENPFETLIRDIHNGPRVTYVTNIFPGKRPGWLLRTAEDLRALLQDTDNFTKRDMGKWAEMLGENWMVIPTEADPPIHAFYRKALNPNFTPQKMVAMSDQIRERARSIIATFKDRGHCEFLNDFAVGYPVNIVLDLLGLPSERLPQFIEWERNLLHTDDMTVRRDAVRAVKDYLVEEIDSRRKNPRDDYITKVLDFEAEDGRKWNADEVFGHCFNLYLGGLDTVTSHLGLAFQHLATHPEDQAKLRENPGISVIAVEEMLRAYAPVTSFRIVSKQIEFAGVTMMPGDYVSVATAVAGRDPLQFDQPDEVRFDRKPSILSLGGGIHKCLGMHLARRELQIAMEEFTAAIPEFRLADGFRVPFHVGNILHVEELQLVW